MGSFPAQVLLYILDAMLYVGEFVVDHYIWTMLTLLVFVVLTKALPKLKWHRRIVQSVLWPVGFTVIARCAIKPNYLAAYRNHA